jgi:hypothetical protein
MSPSEVGLKLYISRLLKTYALKKSRLDKKRNEADEEINKLHTLRQVLIEKNMAGTYSDEIFKEQNAAIENRIVAAQSVKNEALIDQYNIEDIVAFIKAKLADLSATYETSTLSQLRCLLGSIFLAGLIWDYPGCSNRMISPVYQSILDCGNDNVKLGEPGGIRTHDQELKRLLLYH